MNIVWLQGLTKNITQGFPTMLWELLCWETFLCFISVICCFFLPRGNTCCKFYINNFLNFLCGVATDVLSVKNFILMFSYFWIHTHNSFFFIFHIFYCCSDSHPTFFPIPHPYPVPRLPQPIPSYCPCPGILCSCGNCYFQVILNWDTSILEHVAMVYLFTDEWFSFVQIYSNLYNHCSINYPVG